MGSSPLMKWGEVRFMEKSDRHIILIKYPESTFTIQLNVFLMEMFDSRMSRKILNICPARFWKYALVVRMYDDDDFTIIIER